MLCLMRRQGEGFRLRIGGNTGSEIFVRVGPTNSYGEVQLCIDAPNWVEILRDDAKKMTPPARRLVNPTESKRAAL